MQAKKRYFLLFFLFFLGGFVRIALITYEILVSHEVRQKTENSHMLESKSVENLRSYLTEEDLFRTNQPNENDVDEENWSKQCTMNNCFNFSKCHDSFKIHIYPEMVGSEASSAVKVSEGYGKILAALKKSSLYTSKPDEACLFVLSFDTLDRDVLSGDYVKNLRSKFASLPENVWNGGLNHLIFNLYPGTWPNYDPTDLGFDLGKAITAKASFSVDHFRPNFDVSLPLFHKTLPLFERSTSFDTFDAGTPQRRAYLLVFKGKRYVHGSGSDTRNSLYHLHNGKDVIMLTTCRHGKNWQQVKDERCDTDNELYDKWTYEDMLSNSSFCLIPRGRRFGSFRFLESLEAGCIPVILSNQWELPFSEVIVWKEAAIWADERLLFQLPSFLRSIPLETVVRMRQQAKHLSRLYFSTVEQIVYTTLEIINRRLHPSTAPDLWTWNRLPGGIRSYSASYSDVVSDYPLSFVGKSFDQMFTAVVHVPISYLTSLSVVWKQVARASKSKYCSKIYVIFPFGQKLPVLPAGFTSNRIKLVIRESPALYFNELNSLNLQLETEAIFLIDSSIALTTDEIDFAMELWRWFRHRLVGYFAYSHYWNVDEKRWRLTSVMSNCYSIISDGALIVHRYYLQHLYDVWLRNKLFSLNNMDDACFDVKLNLMVADISGLPPIKLTSKRWSPSSVDDELYFTSKRKCFDQLVANSEIDISLIKSCSRLDPVLYKDSVSNLRKKYKQMEVA